jgi:hypothetical protein
MKKLLKKLLVKIFTPKQSKGYEVPSTRESREDDRRNLIRFCSRAIVFGTAAYVSLAAGSNIFIHFCQAAVVAIFASLYMFVIDLVSLLFDALGYITQQSWKSGGNGSLESDIRAIEYKYWTGPYLAAGFYVRYGAQGEKLPADFQSFIFNIFVRSIACSSLLLMFVANNSGVANVQFVLGNLALFALLDVANTLLNVVLFKKLRTWQEESED